MTPDAIGEGLEPCPFCGMAGVSLGSFNFGGFERHHVVCDDCGCAAQGHDTPEEAIAAWNRRAAQPTILQGEELEVARDYAPHLDEPVKGGWLLIDGAPETKAMQSIKVLVWGPEIGTRTGSLHRWPTGSAFAGSRPTVTIGNIQGDAVENGLVTHWQPDPAPPTTGCADG